MTSLNAFTLTAAQVKGEINLKQTLTVKGEGTILLITNPGRVYHLTADSKQQVSLWLKKIESICLEEKQGRHCQTTAPCAIEGDQPHDASFKQIGDALAHENNTPESLPKTNILPSKYKEFHDNVPEVPEEVIDDFHCSVYHQPGRLPLLQGKLYLTKSFFCFLAFLLGKRTCVIFKIRHIQCVDPDTTLGIFPNVIKISVFGVPEPIRFGSFFKRDTTLNLLNQLWKDELERTPFHVAESSESVHVHAAILAASGKWFSEDADLKMETHLEFAYENQRRIAFMPNSFSARHVIKYIF